MRRYSRDRLDESDKIRNKQHDNDGVLEITKVWTSISIKKNKTLVKKKKSGLRYSSKRTRIKTLTSNIYKTREIIIYKRLSWRLTLQEMNTIK